jgi:hypothetical protein
MPTPGATGVPTDAGPSGPRFDQAMIEAMKRGVFARPLASFMHPNQAGQGIHGGAGEPFGRSQGSIGAAVPQMGAGKRPGAGTISGNAPGTAPVTGGQGGQPQPASGLGQFAPLLMMLGPLLMHIFGGLFGGGGAGQAIPQLGPQAGSTSRGPGTI